MWHWRLQLLNGSVHLVLNMTAFKHSRSWKNQKKKVPDMLSREHQRLLGRTLDVWHIFKFRQSWTSESEMVVPVDLPSVKPRCQCFVKRVSSSLKLRQRKQLHFPALASLTDRVHCTNTHSRKPYPPTHRHTTTPQPWGSQWHLCKWDK